MGHPAGRGGRSFRPTGIAGVLQPIEGKLLTSNVLSAEPQAKFPQYKRMGEAQPAIFKRR
jgi:hypothetical protein